ncbi:hypothetical protein A0H81_05116 [Grifola frondosa]|uniref:BTB domain-containing protein n=1 Tax=Grifola frondosa TaxID=5627 RepID=A0A1C7MCY3_GRIFR|nr:hypothetical protein A0H81_05116 [Grifola frondosa]
MSSDITSRKRPRVEDSVDGTVGGGNELELKRDNVQRDADIWFADGNVVLIAGNVTFRVHKSLLAQHSQVFSDIFTVPQPPDAEIMDGCPVVTVSDSPQDFKHLLVLIFKNQNFFQVGTSIPFGMLSAVIRWDTNRFSDWLDESPALVKLNWTLEDAIDVVHIARLTNTESILPVALYYCCHLEAALVEGVQREDGPPYIYRPKTFADV